jgi:YHS domain-containing protein
LALDGFCAVRLADKNVWVQGDRRWGAFHRGHTYLFAGPEEQKQFLANPDKYTPVLSGIDIVLVVDRGATVAGSRAYGGTYANRLYLFASLESLKRFNANKDYYVKSIQQAMLSNGVASAVRQ